MEKILFYISTIRGGGAARVMVNLANGLVERGFDVCFVTNFPDMHEYSLRNEIKRINIESEEFKGNVLSRNASRIIKLRKYIKAENPDVCIAFMRENNFRLAVATKGLKIKSIVSVRSDPQREYRQKGSKQIANILYRWVDGIVFQTEDARSYFPENIQKKSAIIFNQVADKFFVQNSEVGEYILASGRLSEAKNYPMMLRAFKQVLDSFPNETLRIFGDGVLEEELKNEARNLGIEGSVQFMGFSNDMSPNYLNAKFLLLTSDYEGMPNAILEALASSTPVISTDCPCGGPKMVIQDGINGFLIPVGNAEECANKMIYLLNNPDVLVKMKTQAYKSSQAFRSDIVLNAWINYMNSILRTNGKKEKKSK